ncbi:MAG TPA: hypothetical protein VMT20_05145 [Terriglobia bacterium]|nr:hypothetical protein [Terriglobia bacterium]
MSLIQKLASAAQRAANQANGCQSQGPVTAKGLQHSRTARLRHGLYAQFFEETMDALGEDLGGFAERQEALVRYWQPPDAFRATLVMRLARLMLANGTGRLPTRRYRGGAASGCRGGERTIRLLRDLKAKDERAGPAGASRTREPRRRK